MTRHRGKLVLLLWAIFGVLLWQSQRLIPRAITLRNLPKTSNWQFSRDGELFYFGDEDQVEVYDVLRGERVATWQGSIHSLNQVRRTAEHASLAITIDDKSVMRVVNLIDGRVMATFAPTGELRIFADLAPNGRVVAVTEEGSNRIRVWSLERNDWLEPIVSEWPVRHVMFSPDSLRIMFAGISTSIHIVDLATRSLQVVPTQSTDPRLVYRAPLITVDGRLIAMVTLPPSEMGIWDIIDDRLIAQAPIVSNGLPGDGRYWIYTHYPAPVRRLAMWAQKQGMSAKNVDRILELGREVKLIETTHGHEVASFPAPFWYANFKYVVREQVLVYYDYHNGTIEHWDIPPRRAAPRWAAWLSLLAALATTRWWWRTRRRERLTPFG